MASTSNNSSSSNSSNSNSFASMLGMLNQSASQCHNNDDVRRPSSANRGVKRNNHASQEDDDDENSIRNSNDRPRRPPRDVGDLTVRVDFMCIGAQKAGTTWLFDMLSRCPDVVSLPPQKEVHFWDWYRSRGLRWYSQQFPQTAGGSRKTVGEVTPCYMALPSAAVEEIATLFPRLRVIFIARDMVDRAWSALTMELRNASQGLTPGQFADDQPNNDHDDEASHYSDEYFLERLQLRMHRERNDYATGLRRWLSHFGASQVLLVPHADIGTLSVLQRDVGSFLGLPDDWCRHLTPPMVAQRIHAAPSTASPLRPRLRQKMQHVLRPYAQDFNHLLQELGYSWRLNEYATSPQEEEEETGTPQSTAKRTKTVK